jgi:hypothetical protein
MANPRKTSRGIKSYELLIPFEFEGTLIETVQLAPMSWDLIQRWEAGLIPGLMPLLAEVSGLRLEALGQICHPDTDAVMALFSTHVPPHIAAGIAAGQIPAPQARQAPEPPGYGPEPETAAYAPSEPLDPAREWGDPGDEWHGPEPVGTDGHTGMDLSDC